MGLPTLEVLRRGPGLLFSHHLMSISSHQGPRRVASRPSGDSQTPRQFAKGTFQGNQFGVGSSFHQFTPIQHQDHVCAPYG